MKPASDSSSDEDDVSSVPPSFAPNVNRGRRTSVSAESMAPTSQTETAAKVVIPKTDSQKQRIRQAIKNNFLFRNLDDEQYQDVVNAMSEKTVTKGEDVIKQGGIGDYFYIVETGKLDVYVQRLALNNNTPTKVTDYSAGGSFGELALMYNAPRAATVTAAADSVLWALDRVTFRRILMDSTNQKRKMYEKFLEEVPLLKGLEAYELHKIADALESVVFESGQTVIKQGDVGDNFFIIESGSASVNQVDENGVEHSFPNLERGAYFGELALLTNKPRAATIKANGPLKCATLGKKSFDRLLGSVKEIIQRNVGVYRGSGQRKDVMEIIAQVESGKV